MNKRLAGYDMNGWRDICARSWLDRPGEEPLEDGEFLVSGGVLSQVVKTDQDQRHPYVGGVQASLSAHGKGGGWGAVGNNKRLSIRDILDDPTGKSDALSAGFRASAPAPHFAVLAIADHEGTTESKQEAWLSAMRKSGVRQPFLVWRPVLAFLGALGQEGLSDFGDRQKVGVVGQHGPGLTTQVLTLRDTGQLTPERRRSGLMFPSRRSLNTRFSDAQSQLEKQAGCHSRDRLDLAKLTGMIALGDQTQPEAFRIRNGSWTILDPFHLPLKPEPELFASLAQKLTDCDVVLLDTRMGADLSAQLADELQAAVRSPVVRLASDAVARGALEAARRLGAGEPAFFDFLPQISTLVQGESGAVNHNLVPEGEVLPAGKLYRSRTPARFFLLPGQDQVSVYLRKETENAPRLARINGVEEVATATEVELILEQQPASGRARLTLGSAALASPHVIDFDAAEIQEETWEQIIARHEKRRPTIPARMVLENGMEVWDGFANRGGLSELLGHEISRQAPNWGSLATQLSARPEGRYAISSDGTLPMTLSLEDEATLNQMIDRAQTEVLERLDQGAYQNNDALRFLTWTFRRCPHEVVPPMIDALSDPSHPFRGRGRLTLVLQGLGRALQRTEDMRPVINHLLSLPIAGWKKDQTACMAFLVSRTDEVLPLLGRADVEKLTEIVRVGLERECGRGYTSSFIYLPILLVGLLRWRVENPFALVAGQDAAADRMAEPLDAIISDLSRRARDDARLNRYLKLLQKSREELSGDGSHGHLLADLYGMSGGK